MPTLKGSLLTGISSSTGSRHHGWLRRRLAHQRHPYHLAVCSSYPRVAKTRTAKRNRANIVLPAQTVGSLVSFMPFIYFMSITITGKGIRWVLRLFSERRSCTAKRSSLVASGHTGGCKGGRSSVVVHGDVALCPNRHGPMVPSRMYYYYYYCMDVTSCSNQARLRPCLRIKNPVS